MQRALDRLATELFDVLVVGGGIQGAAIAWDAADRGLAVALVDRGDFGGATSANSATVVHGGVRALQRGALDQLRRFVREQRALLRIAPHLVSPLAFLVPTSARLSRQRWVLAAYFALYDLLALDRNRLPDPSRHLPRSRLVSRAECLALDPLADPATATGGLLWHDGQMWSPDRLTLAFVQSAVAAGAAAANYVEACGCLTAGERVVGVRARDRLAGGHFDIRAQLVVNAAGPWAPEFLDRHLPGAGTRLVPCLVRAFNLVTAPLVGEVAVGGEGDGRFLFAIPWREATILGTFYGPYAGRVDELRVTRADVEGMLEQLRRAFPAARLGVEDVRRVHRGLLPARRARDGEPRLLEESVVRDHAPDGAPGLLSVVSVRYTTARETAERTVDLIYRRLGRRPPPCRTATRPLVGGEIDRLDRFLDQAADTPGIDPLRARRLARTYGTRYRTLVAALTAHPGDGAPLAAPCDITRGEIRHAVRHEMALHLADAVLRRTDAGSAGHPGTEVLRAAAAVMAEELGWPASTVDREVADCEQIYWLDA